MSYDDEDDFDYDDFVDREFGRGMRPSKSVPRHWQFVAISLVLFFLLTIWISLGLWTPF